MTLSTGSTKYLKGFLDNEEKKKKMHFYEMLRVTLIYKIMKEQQSEKKEFIYRDDDISYLKPLSGFDLTKKEAYLTGKLDEYNKYYRLVSHEVKNLSKKQANTLEKELQGKSITPRLILSTYKKVINK